MTEAVPPAGGVTQSDMERFLAGELTADSPEWKRIMADLENDPDGFAAQYLDRRGQQLADEGLQQLDRVWQASMSPELSRVRERLRQASDTRRSTE